MKNGVGKCVILRYAEIAIIGNHFGRNWVLTCALQEVINTISDGNKHSFGLVLIVSTCCKKSACQKRKRVFFGQKCICAFYDVRIDMVNMIIKD